MKGNRMPNGTSFPIGGHHIHMMIPGQAVEATLLGESLDVKATWIDGKGVGANDVH